MAYAETTFGLYNELQRHLLEKTVDNGVTWQLHTATEVHESLNLRIARFVMETGFLRTRGAIPVSDGDDTYDLPAKLSTLWRVVWFPDDTSTHTTLERTDPLALDQSRPNWTSPLDGDPDSYLLEPLPILTIQLVPQPDGDGDLEILYTTAPTPLGAANVALPIPALFSPYIKWGVLADLLSKEGEGQDPARAEYAEERYQEGVELVRMLLTGS